MIITRTPFRVSFFGGGTDLPEYYKQYGGAVVSTSINRYMYITVHKHFDYKVKVSYSKIEEVNHIEEIKHPLVRECLIKADLIGGVSISSISDVPAGTGLGSSSSFTVGLLNALYRYVGKKVSRERLAEDAFDIEVNKCGEPIGKQDQYAAALGGFRFYSFNQTGTVTHRKLNYINNIFDNLIFVRVGDTRAAQSILTEQKNNISNSKITTPLGYLKYMASQYYFNNDDQHKKIGPFLNYAWEIKKQFASNITNASIDILYSTFMRLGATGGKLLGAGGGGFLMMYADAKKHALIKKAIAIPTYNFRPEFKGSQIIYED